MCAISGTLGLADSRVVRAMNDAMAHRGPDDHGVFSDAAASVALGHRRLSIIDVSAGGHQPMASPDGRFHIVYNGEIYNYRELRAELEAAGVRFRSRSDTEVLLAAYARWGAQCVARLDGMFAFAIHDRHARSPRAARLFLARDRLGIKPLYYTLQDGVFLFASEIKGLLASARVPRRVDPCSAWRYLSLGSTAQPRTIIDGVSMLAPGYWMEVTPRLELHRHRWWDLADSAALRDPAMLRLDPRQAAARVRELLEQATRRHLVADVEVGAFLSGGLDSGTVVGLMSRVARGRVKTFSVGFGEGRDELEDARAAARRFGTEHHEVIVSGERVAEDYDDLVRAIDQPSLDGTNTWLVARAAAEHVKVALSGLGGDELFAGYPHFAHLARAGRWGRWLRPPLARALARVLARAPRERVADPALLSSARGERYLALRNLARADADALAGPWLQAHPAGADLREVYLPWLRRDMDVVRETSHVELRGYLVNTLLRDADAVSMACSLELRPLLLDHHLVEFAFALPARLKLGDGVNKPALVNAVSDLLPAAQVRRAKTGFELPLSAWLAGPLRNRAREAFAGTAARALFSPRFLARTDTQLAAGERSSVRLWAYLCLVEWMQVNRCEPAP
jgi:asparagine synthase (glutamine-hydrolysing)